MDKEEYYDPFKLLSGMEEIQKIKTKEYFNPLDGLSNMEKLSMIKGAIEHGDGFVGLDGGFLGYAFVVNDKPYIVQDTGTALMFKVGEKYITYLGKGCVGLVSDLIDKRLKNLETERKNKMLSADLGSVRK